MFIDNFISILKQKGKDKMLQVSDKKTKSLYIKKGQKKYLPSSRASWLTKLGSEFFGTILLVWMIGLLGVTFNGVKFESIISFGSSSEAVSRLVVGIWVGLDVLLCIAIFSRWSCDLNPAVTTYRMIAKQNDIKYGFSKIGMQIMAALIAGLAIWASQQASYNLSGLMADNANSASNSWSAFTNTNLLIDSKIVARGGTAGRHFLALGGEFLGGLILLWPIFTKSIKSSGVKDLVLVFGVVIGVSALLEIGTVGWNPARSLGTNFIFDSVKGGTKAMQIYWAYALGPILAAFTLYYTQQIGPKWFTPAWEKWLQLGKIQEK